MFDLIAGTQVHYQSDILGVYNIQGGSSSFVVHSFVLDLNPSDQRNRFCFAEGEIFLLTQAKDSATGGKQIDFEYFMHIFVSVDHIFLI